MEDREGWLGEETRWKGEEQEKRLGKRQEEGEERISVGQSGENHGKREQEWRRGNEMEKR